MILKVVFAFTLFATFILTGYSQTPRINLDDQPQVGKPMPHFTLNNIYHYKKERASLEDFRGRWLLLDFWYRGCTASIKSFPKMNALQKQFGDHVLQCILIGNNSKRAFGKDIKPFYEKLMKKQDLDLPVTYDSTLKKRWNIMSYPHLIIIDPNGIVRSITTGEDLTAEKLKKMIAGQSVVLKEKMAERTTFALKKPLHSKNNSLYQSLLTKWSGEGHTMPDIRYFSKSGRSEFLVSMAPLEALYNLAYFGASKWIYGDPLYNEVYPRPVLELEDSSPFSFNYDKETGLYNFGLTLPPGRMDEDRLMSIMRNELKNVFGYEISLESRVMPVWYLIALPGAKEKLETKGEASGYTNDIEGDGGAAGFGFKNYPMSHLLELIIRYIYDYQIPYYDITGIEKNIDITMDALLTEQTEVVKALKKNGLDLVKGEKRMKVLVVREANNNFETD